MVWFKRKPIGPVINGKSAADMSVVEKLENAKMLIETAWMDIEPIPCEVAGVKLIEKIIETLRGQTK